MKTAGELLKEKRLAKELTLIEVGRRLKVRPEYLQAVEDNQYQLLPSATAAKGFLRNYARLLYLNPDTILAMFRRDFAENAHGAIIPRGELAPLIRQPRLISANWLLSALGILVFSLFMGWQILNWLKYPELKVISPVSGEVYVGKVTIRGTTDQDAVVSINNQKVLVDESGNFSLNLAFPPGTHAVLIEATSRAGKTKLVEKTFQVSD